MQPILFRLQYKGVYMAETSTPLMPKAVAVWLIDNTSLTFDQIAKFCNLHQLEVKSIADGEIAVGVAGCNPITMGQITKEELDLCEKDKTRIPKMLIHSYKLKKSSSRRKAAKYTPIARRRDKPDAICWILKCCPEMQDSQIARLIGTTKNTISAIRSKKHWNMSNIKPRDPVLLGLCSQSDLDEAMLAAQINSEKQKRLKNMEDLAIKADQA